ncbi:MAG: hypothetical protein M1815_001746 [Lichina confinis]|nr:MAG: hypothetical protein M1815_001746 [Lichina confinis]
MSGREDLGRASTSSAHGAGSEPDQSPSDEEIARSDDVSLDESADDEEDREEITPPIELVTDDSEEDGGRDLEGSPSGQSQQFHRRQKQWNEDNSDVLELVSSLSQQRAADLSFHLYNAHFLKRRLRDPSRYGRGLPWAAKDSWIGDLGPDDETCEDAGYPLQSWTAWPLPPDAVPREGEIVGWSDEDEDEKWTLKQEASGKPSHALEDILTARIAEAAKDRFNGRQWEDDAEELLEPDLAEKHGESTEDNTKQRQRQRSKNDAAGGHRVPQPEGSTEAFRPVVLADVDEINEILRPTVRHLLTKLDNLLMDIHRSRQVYLTSNNKAFDAGDRQPREAKDDNSGEEQPNMEPPPRKKQRGRPRKYGEPLEGESYWTMRRRILKEQGVSKRPDHSTSMVELDFSPPSQSTLQTSQVSHEEPTSGPTARRQETRQRRLGLRDWSEVLGFASMTGWDPDVVSRAAERCSRLFGERMDFRTLKEQSATYPRKRARDSRDVHHPRMMSLSESP